MKFLDVSKKLVDHHYNKKKFLATICTKRKIARGSIRGDLRGIYIFCKRGTDIVIYVGQTRKSVSTRIRNHLKSIIDPNWKTELTGLMFIAAKLKLDMEIDVYYIDAEDLGIETRDQYLAAETMFKNILNAKANAFRCSH